MIRTLQAIDWGLLAPYPIALHKRVSVFAGQNGSGKSSAMDACKAILGVNRFGQGRSAASYIHSGRDIMPPAANALLLVCCQLPQSQASSLPFCDEEGRFTLLLNVTRSRRLFLAIQGHTVLGVDDRTLQDDIDALEQQHPRKAWLSPEDYQRRVLDPIGATKAVQTILSIPQGESQRLLEARPDRLLRDLLSLMGALEPLQELDRRRDDHARASEERDKALRALLEEQLQTERASQRLAEKSGELPVLTVELDRTVAQARGAVAATIEDLRGQQAALETAVTESSAAVSTAKDQLSAVRDRERRAASAPAEYHDARKARDLLIERGVFAELVGEHVDEQARDSGQASAMRSQLCAVVVPDGAWQDARAFAKDHPSVTFLKASSAAAYWSEHAPSELEVVGSHVEVDGLRLVPHVEISVPFQAPDPEAQQHAQRAVWEAEQQQSDGRKQLDAVARRLRDAQQTAQDLGNGEADDVPANELSGLLGSIGRLRERIAKLERAAKRQTQLREQLERSQERQAHAQELLDGQEAALQNASAALSGAREAYQRQVRALVGQLDEHFQQLCQDASMRGKLTLVVDPLAEAGGKLNVEVAESQNAPLRDYAEADLSGGWRAKCAVLVLLSALCAAGGERVLNCVLLDEHAAQLDEDRQQELGWVFQLLARRREGMQFILTMPTKRSSERLTWTDLQVAFLKAPPGDRYAPLPHCLEAPDDATNPTKAMPS